MNLIQFQMKNKTGQYANEAANDNNDQKKEKKKKKKMLAACQQCEMTAAVRNFSLTGPCV